MEKDCMLSTGKLPLGGLHKNCVVRITESRYDLTAVYTMDVQCNAPVIGNSVPLGAGDSRVIK